jgi:RNA polymerase primary sigma factor
MKTYDEDWSTKKLIEETVKYKILGRKAETELFREYYSIKDEKRRQDIKVAIIQSNLRFVLAVAKAYKKSTGLPINDFFAEGKLGMLEAFNKFDYTCGTKFGSFAVFEIRRHMDLIVHNSDVVRVPVRIRKRVLKAKKRGESVDNIQYGHLADNAVSEPASIESSVISSTVTTGAPIVLADTIASDDRTDIRHDEELRRETLKNVLEDNLTPEETNLLRRLYGLDGYEDTVSEISAERRVSKEIIRRIKNRALAKLRSVPVVSELRDALGN